jgi:hypothetical protein
LLSPAELLARVQQPLGLLRLGGRDRPLRQRSLRATIAWSYGLLTPAARQLFPTLSVFVGGCSLEAAESVCGDGGGDVLDALATLINSSLVRTETEPEPRLYLLDTVREYALERLGAAEALRARHAAYFLDVAERAAPELLVGEQETWLERLDRDRDNFRAALEWARSAGAASVELRLAGALWRFWYLRGHLREGRARLEGALERGAGEPAGLRLEALRGAAGLALRQADHGRARALLAEAVELCGQLGDRPELARTLGNLGNAAACAGDDTAAAAYFEESRSGFAREPRFRQRVGGTPGSGEGAAS